MPSVTSAVDIDRKLREDFRRRLKEYGGSGEGIDPVLAVLFRTVAHQFERFYSDIGRLRLTLLDELIAGLGVELRAARPAQTVLRFISDTPASVPEGTELIGDAITGERLVFRTDATVNASAATLALAFTYEAGALQLLCASELPERIQAARPSLDPVRVNLGPNPAIFLAFENLPPAHLGRLGVYFDIGPDGAHVQRALETEAWCVVDPEGYLSSSGVLRPITGNRGVRHLQWLVDPGDAERTSAEFDIPLRPGFYGGRLFLFPDSPPGRQYLCTMPNATALALQKIFGREAAAVFGQPRAWVRVGLPGGLTGIHRAIAGIYPNAMTASNMERLDQTIYFAQTGTSIPISREGGTEYQLVAPATVLGESGEAYAREMDPSAGVRAGRYALRNGRIEVRPPAGPDGSPEKCANVCAWITTGSFGNTVSPGRVQAFAKSQAAGLRAINPTAAAGGADQESFEDAQARFAEALLSRDRIVTREDLTAAVRAFDRRIASVRTSSGVRRGAPGLQRVQIVEVGVDRNDFADPDAEGPILQRELAGFLAERTLFDVDLAVEMEWI
jgi:hypothetical protein